MIGPGLLAVLGASLVGSAHCIGMCGGFVATIAGARSGEQRRDYAPLLAYHGTRGLAYVTLGGLAGLVGASLDQSATLVGAQRLAGPLMGLVLIAFALATLWPKRAASEGLITLGAERRQRPLERLRLRLSQAVRQRGARAGAAAGLLTALLPCGWLWAYVLVAAATGSVAWGTLVMLAFWLGTVPALFGAGLLVGELGRRLGRHAPKITAALMLALGLLSLAGKLTPMPVDVHEHGNGDSASEAASETGDPGAHGHAHEGEETPAFHDASALPTSAPCH